MKDIHVIFFGTSTLAVSALQRLIDENYSIDLVITMPDAPKGRHLKTQPSPVKQLALAHQLPLAQPVSVKDSEFLQQIKDLKPTVGIVIAFGQIFPESLLQIPQKGFINIHPSLLPLWRGPSPIQASLAAGDTQTGVSVMCLDQKMDHGPVLIQKTLPIQPEDSYLTLEPKLADLGAKLLIQVLPSYVNGSLTPTTQDDTKATYCKLLKKEDGRIHWEQSATQIVNYIRAYEFFPTSYTFLQGKRLKILKAHTITKTGTPGSLFVHDHQLCVATADGSVCIDLLQPAGKKPMTSQAFLKGFPLQGTETFTEQ